MAKLIINAGRTSYSTDQVQNTMTVEELVAELQRYDGKTKVYLSHDGGYMYGGITQDTIRVK